MIKKYFKLAPIFIFVFLALSSFVYASTTNGTIDNVNKTALLCTNDLCVTTSRINFKPTNVSSDQVVHVTDTEITGFAWSEDMGWIVLNCSNTTSGCSSTNDNFKVANDEEGNLSGYAWGQNAGWINFGPFLNNDATPVSINTSGEFEGWAWAQNYGWIKFDCAVTDGCVSTDWRPKSTRDDGDEDNGGGGGVTGGTVNPPAQPPVTPPVTPPITPPTEPPVNPTVTPDVTPVIPGELPVVPLVVVPSQPPVTPPVNNGGNEAGNGGGGSLSGVTQILIDNIREDLRIAEIAIREAVVSLIESIKTPAGRTITDIITATGVIAGASISLATLLFANPLTFSELFLIPLRIWSLILAALGIKRRSRPWGTVYDSVTKQPIDPAYVVLQDLNGNEVATSITDLDGRYGFLVPPGQYTIVANKTNYEFPSKKLFGKVEDELYQDLYFSGIINIAEGEVITKNIPMDSLKFDWNEFAKKDQKLMKFYSKRDVWVARFSNFLFMFGFVVTSIAVIATPKVYNIIIFCIYAVLYLLKHTVLKRSPSGKITQGGIPLSFAIIRVFSVITEHEIIHKVADKTGKYYCLVPNGNYYVKIEKKNEDGSYTLVHTSGPIEVKKGYIGNSFKI